MFDSQILNFGSEVYSPWMPRGGDNIIVTLDLVDKSSKGELTVEVFHKNSDEPGNGTNADMSKSIATGSTDRTSLEWNDLEELVRYRFEVTGTGSGDWALFRMLAPVWFDEVKA